MGAEVSVEGGFIHTAAKNGRLVGAPVYLDVVSVGATMNIMMAAVMAEGNTIIENAAKEPHIVYILLERANQVFRVPFSKLLELKRSGQKMIDDAQIIQLGELLCNDWEKWKWK